MRGFHKRLTAMLLLLALLAGCASAQEVERAASKIIYQDFKEYYLKAAGINAVLVIYLGYTDGHVCDRESFERMFTGEFDSQHRLGSVASYFRYNSYGKADFDFRFVYYDTGMTCRKAYNSTRKNHEQFFQQVFNSARKSYQGDFRELDRDKDGYVDLVVFVSGEDSAKTVGDGERYYIAGGSLGTKLNNPDTKKPAMCQYVTVAYESVRKELKPADRETGPRMVIHEIGHAFGLIDYYDTREYEGQQIDTVGTFDMQSDDVGDWNPFSKLACGWLEPYVITEETETVTLRIGCSSEVGDAILIPTSKGWNGTAFDEYILIDVMAPAGANGFDWERGMDSRQIHWKDPKKNGGVRVYHVDARLLKQRYTGAGPDYSPAVTYDELTGILKDRKYGKSFGLVPAHTNSNGYEPYLADDSRWHHLLDIIPSDGSSKYRISTPSDWSIFHIFTAKDLFGPGETFSMQSCFSAFPDAPYMNNGGRLSYSVTVDEYDTAAREAVVTVKRVE